MNMPTPIPTPGRTRGGVSQKVGPLIALGSAVALAICGASRTWWSGTVEGAFYGAGPRGLTFCRGGACSDGELSMFATGMWEQFGLAVFLCSSAAAFLLGVVAVAHFIRRPAPRWLALLAGGGCLFASGFGAAFAGAAPSIEGLSTTGTMTVFFLAAAAGAASTAVWLAVRDRSGVSSLGSVVEQQRVAS